MFVCFIHKNHNYLAVIPLKKTSNNRNEESDWSFFRWNDIETTFLTELYTVRSCKKNHRNEGGT